MSMKNPHITPHTVLVSIGQIDQVKWPMLMEEYREGHYKFEDDMFELPYDKAVFYCGTKNVEHLSSSYVDDEEIEGDEG